MGSHYSRHSLWLVTTGLDPVVHADSSLTNAGGSAAPAQLPHGLPGLRPAMTKGNERKRFGGETPTDAMSILPWLTATAAPASAQAHIYRRSTAVLVPRSLSSQGTQHQAFSSWDLAASLAGGRAGVTRPCLSQSSEFSSRPSRSARRLMPECRPSGLQSRARAPHSPARAWNASRPRPNRARLRLQVT